jgi:hypothetical protein
MNTVAEHLTEELDTVLEPVGDQASLELIPFFPGIDCSSKSN